MDGYGCHAGFRYRICYDDFQQMLISKSHHCEDTASIRPSLLVFLYKGNSTTQVDFAPVKCGDRNLGINANDALIRRSLRNRSLLYTMNIIRHRIAESEADLFELVCGEELRTNKLLPHRASTYQPSRPSMILG